MRVGVDGNIRERVGVDSNIRERVGVRGNNTPTLIYEGADGGGG
jgi:hypothetical protein